MDDTTLLLLGFAVAFGPALLLTLAFGERLTARVDHWSAGLTLRFLLWLKERRP